VRGERNEQRDGQLADDGLGHPFLYFQDLFA
jgi:hypothetical protein